MDTTQKQFVRAPEAARLLGVSVPTIWRWAREDATFPRKRCLSTRVTVWCAGELRTWADAQAQQLDETPTSTEAFA